MTLISKFPCFEVKKWYGLRIKDLHLSTSSYCTDVHNIPIKLSTIPMSQILEINLLRLTFVTTELNYRENCNRHASYMWPSRSTAILRDPLERSSSGPRSLHAAQSQANTVYYGNRSVAYRNTAKFVVNYRRSK